MKKTILAFSMMLATGLMAQNFEKNDEVQYHFFTNNIPSEFNFPLIGFVNNVYGNHSSVQIGFINSTQGNFGGVQAGLVNGVGGNVTGLQSGFINNTGGNFEGIQSGFINSDNGSFSGFQDGFINSVGGTFYGSQSGFVNSCLNLTGVQTGFTNSTKKTVKGLQYGFVNSAKTLRGVQLGFINSVEKVEKGLPIGFLSFVKQGGYKAIEFSYSSINPIRIAFKTGVRKFYSYPMLAYDWHSTNDKLSFGYGIGSNLDLSKQLFINPELDWLHQISLDFNHYSTLKCNLGYTISDNFELVAGPSLVWQFKIDADDFHHNYTEWDPSIISVNELTVGWNVALRVKY